MELCLQFSVCLYGMCRDNFIFTFNNEISPNNIQKNCEGIVMNSLEVKWVLNNKINKKVRKCKHSATHYQQLYPLFIFRKP